MDPAPSSSEDARRFRSATTASASFVACLWLIHGGALLTGTDLSALGVFPRHLHGLVGVLTAPLVHGSFWHLFSNSVALVVLGSALLYGYPRSARIVLPVIYVGTGIGVWMFARPAVHIGASGLTFGMMFFVFVVGALRWDRRAIALSMLVFFLYGGMVWGIFPGDPSVSFESHAMGAAIGACLAVFLRARDPAPARKRYEWEGADDDEPWPPE